MRLRDVKVGMKVRVKKMLSIPDFTGEEGRVIGINWVGYLPVIKGENFFTVEVNLEGGRFEYFNHKELEAI